MIFERNGVRTDYLTNVFHLDRFLQVVSYSVQRLRRYSKKHPFDAIAFTGMSGAALAYPLSVRLKKPLICVRRDKEDSHYRMAGDSIEGWFDSKRFLIVDDFICTGNTIDRILNKLKNNMPEAQCVAIALYRREEDDYRKSHCWNGIDIPLLGVQPPGLAPL